MWININNCIAKKEFAYRMSARKPTSAMPKPFLCCERAFCCSTVVMWPVLCHEVACRVRWSNVVGCEVIWGELLWLVATWHVVSCHVIWCGGQLIWCDVSACVVSCHVMQCDVMWWAVVFCALRWVHWLRGHAVCFGVVLWRCGDPTTTKYYPSTTPYLQSTQ